MDDHNELRKPIKDLVQYELSEQQLIHIESCLKDIEPAINYLRRTNFSDTTKGLISYASFDLLKSIVSTIREQPI